MGFHFIPSERAYVLTLALMLAFSNGFRNSSIIVAITRVPLAAPHFSCGRKLNSRWGLERRVRGRGHNNRGVTETRC